MQVTIYTAGCTGNAKNCYYKNKQIIDNPDDFKSAIEFDHTCAEFDKNYRSKSSFLSSDVDVMDIDNDHSEDEDEWITIEKVNFLFKDVSYIVATSRNHMKVKGNKSKRPRLHIYFPHEKNTDGNKCAALKQELFRRYPFFDGGALDEARFVYGAVSDEVVWHEGDMDINEFLSKPKLSVIPEGQRNNTMSRFAGRVLKRYGITQRSFDIFKEEAAKCDPPLSENELRGIWNSACRFARKVQSQEGYISPEEYDFQNESLKPPDYSDIGQAKAFIKEYGEEIRYTPATDFIRFDGVCWIESKQRAVAAMEEFLDLQLEDAKDEYDAAFKEMVSSGIDEGKVRSGGKALEKEVGEVQRDMYLRFLSASAYKAFVMKRRDMKYVMSALQAAKPMVEINYEDLDKNPYLLNCPDGTYSLNTKEKRNHTPSDYITKVTSTSPGEAGKDLWLSFIDTVFQGDKELIDYVQMIAGVSAIGEVDLEALIISYGEGSNGKSTFWNTIAGVLGNYSGSISADTLTVGCRRNVKPELAEAKGKRLLIAAELEEGMRLSTSIVKQLCSTDRISAEKKYKDPSDFTPSHMLVLYTNHLPRVGAMDSGTWRRLIVIPFNAKIKGNSDIKNYSKYLLENASPYVLSWLMEGSYKAIECGFKFKKPKCVEDAIGKYKEDSNWLEHFLEDCCELDKTYQERSGKVYEEYRAYCQRTGEFVRSTTEFYTALEQKGFTRRRQKNGVLIYGLKSRVSDFI